jgi:hypothetical protein
MWGEHFWGFPLLKAHSSIPIDTHKCQTVAPDNTWEILSHLNVPCPTSMPYALRSMAFALYFSSSLI